MKKKIATDTNDVAAIAAALEQTRADARQRWAEARDRADTTARAHADMVAVKPNAPTRSRVEVLEIELAALQAREARAALAFEIDHDMHEIELDAGGDVAALATAVDPRALADDFAAAVAEAEEFRRRAKEADARAVARVALAREAHGKLAAMRAADGLPPPVALATSPAELGGYRTAESLAVAVATYQEAARAFGKAPASPLADKIRRVEGDLRTARAEAERVRRAEEKAAAEREADRKAAEESRRRERERARAEAEAAQKAIAAEQAEIDALARAHVERAQGAA